MKAVKRPEKPEYECIGDVEELGSLSAWYDACDARDEYIKKCEKYIRYLEYLSKQFKKKGTQNDRHQETQRKCRTEKLHSRRERWNDVES
jgi:hypothetical protein